MSRSRTLFILCALMIGCSGCSVSEKTRHPERYIAIQHNGQVKSFESFAKQTLESISEKDKWEKKSAVAAVLDAVSSPGRAEELRWIRIRHGELKKQLGLDAGRNLFSYEEVYPSIEAIASLARSSQKKRDQDLRPAAVEQKAESLYGKLMEVKHLSELESLRVLPPASGESWLSPAETPFGKPFLNLLKRSAEKDQAGFSGEVVSWVRATEVKTGGRYSSKIGMEVFYHSFRPFHWAFLLYLLSFLSISIFKDRRFRIGGIVLAIVAFGFHTAGLALRVAILGRPPVSNMFESVVYMNWVAMIAAILFASFRRQAAAVSVGALLGAVIMLYADLLPLDSSLEVLVPVLRSNYWLTIHVMTIVGSYGLLGLAMAFGHRYLILDGRKSFIAVEREDAQKLIYRTMQIGTLMLGIGTTLGGVWANESWGRFWGWDPKETWALITFLGYVILIHLHHFKKIGDFGLAVGSVLGFQLVLMTWYGVNFVLGRGLHSYGQGSGGAIWIVYYLIAESAFLAWVLFRRA